MITTFAFNELIDIYSNFQILFFVLHFTKNFSIKKRKIKRFFACFFVFHFYRKNSKRNTKKHQWFYNSVKTKQRINTKTMLQVIRGVTRVISYPPLFDFPVARVLETPNNLLFQKIKCSSLILSATPIFV